MWFSALARAVCDLLPALAVGTLTVVMGLMLLVYWRASRLLNKKALELGD